MTAWLWLVCGNAAVTRLSKGEYASICTSEKRLSSSSRRQEGLTSPSDGEHRTSYCAQGHSRYFAIACVRPVAEERLCHLSSANFKQLRAALLGSSLTSRNISPVIVSHCRRHCPEMLLICPWHWMIRTLRKSYEPPVLSRPLLPSTAASHVHRRRKTPSGGMQIAHSSLGLHHCSS